jgi:hypothetical protein
VVGTPETYGVTVALDEEELLSLYEVAQAIERNKRHIPSEHWGVDSLESRFLSLCAERAVAKLLGCLHEVKVLSGGDGHVDLVLPKPTRFGFTVEVKFRRERGRDLATARLRFWEELRSDIYVLVWPSSDQDWNPEQGFTVVGFATRQQFLERIIARPPVRFRGEKWDIPWQELTPIAVLAEEVTRVGLSHAEAAGSASGEVRSGEDDTGGSPGALLRCAA